MLVRLVALAALLAVVAAGCGSTSRRHVVAQYIDSVNAIEGELGAPLVEVSQANRDFAKRSASAAAIDLRLQKAIAAIDTDARRLAAIEAPVEARKLRSMLLQLVHEESSLAREVGRFATFLPKFQATLKPLAPAGAKLKAALSAKGKATPKAAALETYGVALGAVLDELGKLSPPPVSVPLFKSQRATLEQVRATSAALALAIRQKRAKDLPQLLHAFNVAAVGNQTRAAQLAQIRAIRAYNARIHELDKLAARINHEEARLQKNLH